MSTAPTIPRRRTAQPIYLCTFSSHAADLPLGQRSYRNVLQCLDKHPRVSCFDLTEKGWLLRICASLQRCGFVVYDCATDGYPWVRYVITDAGRKWLKMPADTPLPKEPAK